MGRRRAATSRRVLPHRTGTRSQTGRVMRACPERPQRGDMRPLSTG